MLIHEMRAILIRAFLESAHMIMFFFPPILRIAAKQIRQI